MTFIEVTAPAKVNLFLEVVSKRRDSYHNIRTLFERIALCDKIRITKISEGIEVISDKYITSRPEDNIAYKAAVLLLRHKKIKQGVRINITKRIPVAAGLAGGSSDAAAVLIGIDRLFGLKMRKKELMSLGTRLGADVAFFIYDTKMAIGRQRGDRLIAVKSKENLWHLLINPGFPVSTREVYESFDFALTRKSRDAKIHSPLEEPMDFGTAESMLHNDLEKIVISKKGIIGRIKARLAALLGKKAIVSGSGPSLFCLYKTRKEAMKAKAVLLRSVPVHERKGWKIFVVRTC